MKTTLLSQLRTGGRAGWAGIATALLLLMGGTAGAQDAEEPKLPPGANKMCPVMPDEEATAEFYVDHEGKRIFLCCAKCRRMFKKEPAKYLKELEKLGGTAVRAEGTTGTATRSADEKSTRSAALAPEAPSVVEAAAAPEETAPPPAVPPLTTLEKAARYSGRLHAVSVHFPIGLLLGATAVEAAAVLRRRRVGSEGARITLALGTVGAVIAVPLGWLNAAYQEHPGLEHYVEWHRWLGTAAGVSAILAWALSRAAQSGRPLTEKIYLTALFASAVMIIVSGHFGASLIYGPEYLKPW